ncbi:papain family cysteine protease [Cryptosporidium andersoni]|uniref:Dipeptidyl peptidase 1 n=1 Tax=Cryptosporidium andersoni TaxID=117008 RepID=A0A1J4MUC6_9CRYT|nr:papain family cysteine protease [Cryptosporidium andersoni]
MISLRWILNILGIKGDLPIHATTADIVGRWTFKISEPLDNWVNGCGSGVPNKNTQNLQPSLVDYNKWLKDHTSNELIEYNLILTDILNSNSYNESLGRRKWNQLAVKDLSGEIIGGWTMVYDEGFQIKIGDKNIFGFIKYSLLDEKNCNPYDGDNELPSGETLCYETDPSKLHLGWYYDSANKKRACVFGYKSDSENNTLDKLKNLVEVPVKVAIHKGIRSLTTSLQSIAKLYNERIETSWTARNSFSIGELAFSHYPYYLHTMNSKKIYRRLFDNKNEVTSFMELSSKTINEMNSDSGIFACSVQHEESDIDLPSNFSHGDPFLSSEFEDISLNQGNCGSCYAISSAYILQKRFEIALRNRLGKDEEFPKIELSAQSILSCSPFNQGCDGGYPFLVGKQALEIGISSNDCMEYEATDNKECHFSPYIGDYIIEKDGCTESERWFAKDYGYIGGCYGCSSEESMKREIYHHGPIVVAMHIDPSLLVYEDGIYDVTPKNHAKFCDLPNKQLNGWEYTNHAIVVVGWGEQETSESTDKIPYWIIRNSWGKKWGNKGYAKIRRGKNIGGIENQAIFIDPDLSRGKAVAILNSSSISTKEKILPNIGSTDLNTNNIEDIGRVEIENDGLMNLN